MRLDVRAVCGDDVISRVAGKKIRIKILENWEVDKIEIYLGETPNGSASFFDEAIGLLIKRDEKSITDIQGKLVFPDICEEDRKLLNYVLMARVTENRIK